jgi:hypothetical protein
MSRFSDDGYDEFYPNQAALWHANVHRALTGKRGKKALAELREALLALPEKRLIEGALCTVGVREKPEYVQQGHRLNDGTYRNWWHEDADRNLEENAGEGVCAIGAFLWHKKVQAGMDPDEAFASLPTLLGADGAADWETAEEGKRAGMTFTLASVLVWRNDEAFSEMTPEERYTAFLAYLDNELGTVSA